MNANKEMVKEMVRAAVKRSLREEFAAPTVTHVTCWTEPNHDAYEIEDAPATSAELAAFATVQP